MKKRIWELDALRGLCVLGMVLVHFIYDLVDLYKIVQWDYPPAFLLVRNWGGLLFLLISGICVTLGSHCIRRGLLVFLCGMVCTLVTWGIYRLGLAGKGLIIYFGVLHCLGCCMLLWPLFRRLPPWALAGLGVVLAATGRFLESHVCADHLWLLPLGIVPQDFLTPDYFPLVFNLGFFLLGAALGKTLYKNKTTLLPRVNENALPLRFLRRCGSWSLYIYLLHQPVLTVVCMVISGLGG